MSALNSKSASQKRKRNENRKSPRRKLISQARNRSANVQYPAGKFLRPRPVTFARIHRPIESLANSSSAKRSSGARFRKNRRKSFSPPEKPIFSRASSRNADDLSRRISNSRTEKSVSNFLKKPQTPQNQNSRFFDAICYLILSLAAQ